MTERSAVDLVEEWQTGAFLLLSSALAGVALAIVLGSLGLPYGRAVGFLGGAALAFLALSYLLYGR